MSRCDLPELNDKFRAVEFAIARLLQRPRYDEVTLAYLQVKRDNLVDRIAALRGTSSAPVSADEPIPTSVP